MKRALKNRHNQKTVIVPSIREGAVIPKASIEEVFVWKNTLGAFAQGIPLGETALRSLRSCPRHTFGAMTVGSAKRSLIILENSKQKSH